MNHRRRSVRRQTRLRYPGRRPGRRPGFRPGFRQVRAGLRPARDFFGHQIPLRYPVSDQVADLRVRVVYGDVHTAQRRNHWVSEGVRPSPPPKKKWTDLPNFFDGKCDYRYVTHCSARNCVYHPYFVLYNNQDQGIGPPTLKTWLRP